MSLSIAAVVGGSLCLCALAGGIAGLSEHERRKRQGWASETWRNVKLRNGVEAPSPFHSPTSAINAPGLVRVYPRSQQPKQAPPPLSAEPVSATRPPMPSAELEVPAPLVSNGDELEEELSIEPFELSDPPHEAERARVRRLYQRGMSQTKIIGEVWGLSKGGSKKYYEARRRFRSHVADIATGDLRASIKAEEVEASA